MVLGVDLGSSLLEAEAAWTNDSCEQLALRKHLLSFCFQRIMLVGDGYRGKTSPHTPNEKFEGATVLKALKVKSPLWGWVPKPQSKGVYERYIQGSLGIQSERETVGCWKPSQGLTPTTLHLMAHILNHSFILSSIYST